MTSFLRPAFRFEDPATNCETDYEHIKKRIVQELSLKAHSKKNLVYAYCKIKNSGKNLQILHAFYTFQIEKIIKI